MTRPGIPHPYMGPLIPLDTQLLDLIGMNLVVADDLVSPRSRPLAVRIQAANVAGGVEIQYAPLGELGEPMSVRAPQNETLAVALEERAKLRVLHAMRVPGVRFAHNHSSKAWIAASAIVVPLLVIVMAGASGSAAVATAMAAILMVVMGFAALVSRRRRPVAITGPTGDPMPLAQVLTNLRATAGVSYSEARALGWAPRPGGTRPPLTSPRPASPPPPSPKMRIDRLKLTYGELLSDIAYRIENSALFDNAVPVTRDFQVLLMRWDDEQAGLPAAERATLARQLELAFDTARDHAETVGLSHLPSTARQDGERAVKAARLAARATSEGERKAALEQATRLLSSLALYYLPRPDEVPKMLGGSPPSLGAP